MERLRLAIEHQKRFEYFPFGHEIRVLFPGEHVILLACELRPASVRSTRWISNVLMHLSIATDTEGPFAKISCARVKPLDEFVLFIVEFEHGVPCTAMCKFHQFRGVPVTTRKHKSD